MSAPERIWAWEYQGQHGQEGQWRGSKVSAIGGSSEYTRTDTIPSDPRVKALVELLRRADEELRLIRMKDTGAVYDILLRTDLTAALAALKGAANE